MCGSPLFFFRWPLLLLVVMVMTVSEVEAVPRADASNLYGHVCHYSSALGVRVHVRNVTTYLKEHDFSSFGDGEMMSRYKFRIL